jgi:hypothetical protein
MRGRGVCLTALALLFALDVDAWAAGEAVGLGASLLGRGLVPHLWTPEPASWVWSPAILDSRDGLGFEAGQVWLYGLPELSIRALGIGTGVGRVGVGAWVSHFGWEAYRESDGLMAISTGRGYLRIGGSLLISHTSFHNYGNRTYWGYRLGSLVGLQRNLRLCVSSAGPLYHRAESIGRETSIGLGWRRGSNLFAAVALVKQAGFPVEWRAGLEYSPWGPLLLRGGLTGAPERITLGFAINVRRLRLNYAFVNHASLGGSHAVGFELVPGRWPDDTPRGR